MDEFDAELMEQQDQETLAIEKRRTDNDAKVMRMLARIFRKSPDQITLENKRFMKARVSYMSELEREKYHDILDEDLSGDAPAEPREKPLEEMNRGDLEARAIELGMDATEVVELPNKKAVIEAIRKMM